MAQPIVSDLPICGYFDRQRFRQFGPADSANWYTQQSELGKKKVAMYPDMGRRHVNFLGVNRLQFATEPRYVEKSVNYWYAVVANKIFRIDAQFNTIEITASVKLTTMSGNVFLSFIVVGDPSLPNNTTYVCFVDGQHVYIYSEFDGSFGIVTDSNTPTNPSTIATFGNRIVVAGAGSSTFFLSAINLLGGALGTFSLSKVFTIGYDPDAMPPLAGSAVFAQEEGIIRQMAVLQNTLYLLCDYVTGIWSNIPSTFEAFGGTQTSFPWKKNTSYSIDFGIAPANVNTLDVDFGMMAWVGQNKNGLVQPMISYGGKPQPISTKAVDVLLQRQANVAQQNPFMTGVSDAFLFDYENTIFYRLSAGNYTGTELLDQISVSNSIQYNFENEKWNRCIEVNGERNRIQQHVFLDNRHLVTVEGDSTVYEMSGQYYDNEISNPDASNPQANDAYFALPFRYERITNIIVAGMIEGLKPPGFYAEFKTNYVEIDFVWGDDTFIASSAPFENSVFIVSEEIESNSDPIYITDENGNFIVTENSNYPDLNSPTYYNWFKPNIELLFSDDGGISFKSAGQLEFSMLGVYSWRMRWYQLGCSRNRVYKLVCVSSAPIVILGGTMEVENVSGGAA